MTFLRTSKFRTLSLLCFAVLISGFASRASADAIPSGWTCSGSCGSLGADGVVSLSPTGNPSYQYVTTTNSTATAILPSGPLGSETNGSTLATSIFSATAGTNLNFYFNYITSDGAGFADYAWAELYSSTNTPVALLFTARTEPTGSIVPGTGLPAPAATLNPSSVPIIAGGPAWSPLGSSSGECFSAGCGYTGWINSNYTIAAAGDYYLKVGVTNWIDQAFDSGLAMDGVTVGGVPITPPVTPSAVPEPSTLMLLGTGFVGLATSVKRKLRA